MIVTTMNLHSAVTGKTSTLVTVKITNDGTGTVERGNYRWTVYGRDGRIIKTGYLDNWPRKRKSAGQLLAKVMNTAYPKG